MSKKINIGMPITKNQDENIKFKKNDFFSKQIKIKRLTIDIPGNLHSQIKVHCAKKGVNMVDEIRKILEEKFLG